MWDKVKKTAIRLWRVFWPLCLVFVTVNFFFGFLDGFFGALNFLSDAERILALSATKVAALFLISLVVVKTLGGLGSSSPILPWRPKATGRALVLPICFGLIPSIPFILFWLVGDSLQSAFIGGLQKTSHPQAILFVYCLKHGLWLSSLLILLLMSLLIPVCEEMIFRGYLFYQLSSSEFFKKHLYILILFVSLLFAGAHYPYGFWGQFILSLGATYFRYRTGSMLAPFLTHAVWNLSLFVNYIPLSARM